MSKSGDQSWRIGSWNWFAGSIRLETVGKEPKDYKILTVSLFKSDATRSLFRQFLLDERFCIKTVDIKVCGLVYCGLWLRLRGRSSIG